MINSVLTNIVLFVDFLSLYRQIKKFCSVFSSFHFIAKVLTEVCFMGKPSSFNLTHHNTLKTL